MADIQVIVSPTTVTTVEVPSPVAYPSVIYTGIQGENGSTYNQSLNTTDSPTFVAVNTSDGTLQGGVYPGFYADGHGFEMTHGSQNQGTIDVFAPTLSSGQSVSVTLPSASGTLALTSDITGGNSYNRIDAINIVGDTNHCILSSTDSYTQSKIGGIYIKGQNGDWFGPSTIENNGDGWRIKFNDEGENEADSTGSPSNAVYPASPWLFNWGTAIQVNPCDAQGNIITPETANISISSSFEANQSHLTASSVYGIGNDGDEYGWRVDRTGVNFYSGGGDFSTSYNIGSITNVVDDGTPAVCQLPAVSGTIATTGDISSIVDTAIGSFQDGLSDAINNAVNGSIGANISSIVDTSVSTAVSASLPGLISTALDQYNIGGGSSKIVYASNVATLNSNIDTGGGTNVTAQLQAVLDSVQNGGHLELVIDGVALISTLRVWKNTTIRCLPGCGFFQAPGTNWHLLTTGYVLPTEPSHDNISLIGGIYNCNGNNQSKWENDHNPDDDPWGWNFGLWIGWFKNFTMRDVLIRNAKTFSVTLMQGDGVVIENCSSLWDDGGDLTGANGRNRDGLHFWSPVSNVRVKGYVSNGDDDVIALNTAENTNVNSWPTAQPRRGTGGTLENLVFEDIEFRNSANGIRIFSENMTASISNVVFRNIYGNIVDVAMQDDGVVSKDFFEIYGWNVTGESAINISNAERVRLSAIKPGTSINVTANKTSGDGFSANLGWTDNT